LLVSRWDTDQAGTLSGELLPRFAGHLANVDQFDAAAFSTSRSEAAAMDPQQRLLLERTAEAVLCNGATAHCGVTCENDVGVFIGLSSTDYAALTAVATPDLTAFTATGVWQSAGRA